MVDPKDLILDDNYVPCRKCGKIFHWQKLNSYYECAKCVKKEYPNMSDKEFNRQFFG